MKPPLLRYLFGTEGNESILIDFLNATFLDSNLRLIESVEVLNLFNFADEKGRDMRFVIEKNPEIKKAHEYFEVFTSDDRVRALHDAKIKSEFGRNSLIAIARIEGEEFGLQKGNLEERIEIAKVLKSLGDLVEKIMKVTGLTLDEIKNIKLYT